MPYFIAKAREYMHKAGGDPDLAGPLADWARAARAINDTNRGVIVAEDGTIVAQTRRMGYPAAASYVTQEDAQRYGLHAEEVGLAMGELRRITGQRLVHVTMSDVCCGASKFIKRV